MFSPVSLATPRAGDGVRILGLAQSFCKTSGLTLASPTPFDKLPPELGGLEAHWAISFMRRGNIVTGVRAALPGVTYDSARYRYGIDLPGGGPHAFDAVYVNLPQGWSIWERIRRHVMARVVVIDVQNDELDMWNQRAAAETHWLLRQACIRFGQRSEARTRRMVIGANLIVVVSERDAITLERRLGPAIVPKLRVVPNGVDVSYFRPPATNIRDHRSAVFVGSLDTRMNQKAARELIDVWPRVTKQVPHAKLTIAGRNPPPWLARSASESVRVVSSPPDIRPYLWEAGAFVAPFEAGGGTKIKLLEAMAAGAPIVSSASGVQGLSVEAHKHYVPIDRIDDLPAALTDLTNAGEGDAIAREATQIAEMYDWAAIGRGAVDHVRSTVSELI